MEAIPTAQRTTLPPIREVGSPAPEVSGASIPAAQVESRTQATEQQIRQQGAQQMAEQAQQASTAREQAALGKDQGRVVARIQALTAPRQTVTPAAPGDPRHIVIHPGPGVRQIFPSPQGGGIRRVTSAKVPYPGGMKEPYGLKTGSAEKTALDTGDLQRAFDEVREYVKKNPWSATAAGGAALGTGLGWATSDPETRKRKMLMGLITGGMLGGTGGLLGEKAIRSMADISEASKAVRHAGEAASGLAEEGSRQVAGLGGTAQGALQGVV